MSRSLRVLVTGSRTWADKFPVYGALDALAETATLTIVHGAASGGADYWADRWHSFCAGHHIERHPAEWARHGKRAGFIRNTAMAKLGADICLAFIRNDSNGATHCAREAEANDIPVVVFRQTYPDLTDVAAALAVS